MKILFTICARAGSKGVKSKNTREFLGVPLCYYTLSSYMLFLKKYKKINDIIDLSVNTDSSLLVEQISKTNIEFLHIERTDDLAGDTVSKLDVIRDTLIKTQEKNNIEYDVLVDIDLTSPIRTAMDIKGVIDSLISNDNSDLSFSVTNSRRNPYFNMVKSNDDFYETIIKSDFVARQQAPTIFDMNASIYAYRSNFVLDTNNKKVLDGKALCYKMMDTAVLDIDSEEDLELMEILAKYFYGKYEELNEVKQLAFTLQNK